MNRAHRACLIECLQLGFAMIDRGQPAVEAVEAIIRIMEGSGIFNAGAGSRRQSDGVQRMDASIMDGQNLRAGAVAGVENIRYPISAARMVMEHTPHVLFVGKHAARLARLHGLERARRPSKKKQPVQQKPLNQTGHSMLLMKEHQYDTVGAVVLDRSRNLAAGTSTGGIPRMQPGRVGDTPLIGCGLYADNLCGAISMTGIGETIMRLALAKQIAMFMRAGLSPQVATRKSLKELVTRIQGEAGALVLSPTGHFAIQHTTPWMAAGYWDGRGQPIVKDRFR